MLGLDAFLYAIFIGVAWIMTIYTLNFYYLSYQSQHNVIHQKRKDKLSAHVDSAIHDLPVVTVQLPIYNERYVAARLIDAVCLLDYPKDRLEIQVLDDSEDDTFELVQSVVGEHRLLGFNIHHFRRISGRAGYKAGALKEGMKYAKGEFIAIFDADFIPPPWFLKKTIGYFIDPVIGLVQCRWGHINENYSSLTEAQALSLDLHFLIEQKAKSMTHLFMNFNGAAGIWRTSCIFDAGGWHTTTLVEDLDLSYRAQLRGWKSLFLENIVVKGELPVQMNAAKRQQFRWAKGSIQVALKLLVDILLEKKIAIDTKIQAFIHLTRHVVHVLFLIQFLVFPILLALNYKLYPVGWAPITGILIYVLMGPATYIYMIRKLWADRWKDKAIQYLYLIFFASGISVNNTIAVFDAIIGGKNEFLRTPKFGVVNKHDEWREKAYVLPFTKTTLLEVFFGIYGLMAIFVSIFSGNPVFVPVIAIQTLGFIYVAYLSIIHSSLNRKQRGFIHSKNVPTKPAMMRMTKRKVLMNDRINTTVHTRTLVTTAPHTRNTQAWTRYCRLLIIGILGFLSLGAAIIYFDYQSAIYPLDEAIGYLSRAESAQTTDMIINYLRPVNLLLPNVGNPVWSFPSPRTDFGLIHNDLDSMLLRTRSISLLEPNTAGYNTGLEELHGSIRTIESNLEDATPYIYVSSTNILLGGLWIGVIMSLLAAMWRSKSKLKEYETT
ncbi:MAG TPA: glycosyltransferase [Candidatus Bathyarchaeia archaeon]|nr:glycosyltransferase [Candidatus Bathyarchaeia archaeon]